MYGLDFTTLPRLLQSSILDGVTGITKDHLGYRFDSIDEYIVTKNYMLSDGYEMISEETIAGRPCSYWKLQEPIEGFEYLELQAPRTDEPMWAGLEHLEYVADDIDALYAHLQTKDDCKVGQLRNMHGNKIFKAQQDQNEIKFIEASQIR